MQGPGEVKMNFFDRLEQLFVAVTFAEAGEVETAKQLLAKTNEAEPESVMPRRGACEAPAR